MSNHALSSFASYHNHTTWSDGTASVEAMVIAAQEAGLGEIGISDHYVLTPYSDEDLDWAMPRAGLGAYVAEVQAAARSVDIPVRVGVEVDFFPETFEEAIRRVGEYSFDYIIGGVHFANDFPVDCHPSYWEPLDQQRIDAVYQLYWERVVELAHTGSCDIMAHVDLPKKFGFLPSLDFTDLAYETADAAAGSDTALEINTNGWNKPCRAPYPTEELLKCCHALEVPVLVSADAHETGAVGQYFERAASLLRGVGYNETVQFEGRRRRSVPMA